MPATPSPRQGFCEACQERTVINRLNDDEAELVIGHAEWPLPTPLVRRDGAWHFDTGRGLEETLNRRIGANELDAIALCRAVLDAQYVFANRDWDGDGRREFADKFDASDGEYDGLWWPREEDEAIPSCPLQPFVELEEEYVELREPGAPWHGYRARMLHAQGDAASGGAMSYRDGDDLNVGFAMIVWPDEYDVTGIMSFLVSHHGTVYERDLGEDTESLVGDIERFDPGTGWKPVED